MKPDKSRMRLWITSLLTGCAISGALTAFVLATRTAFYFPPFWPGLFFAWIVIILSRGESWAGDLILILATLGNAAVYAWLYLRVIKAEVSARGRVGRYFA
jgi:hypothetical protein